MGKLIWHELAGLIALAANFYLLWANMWALYYRKFALDFIGGTLGPHGIVPPARDGFFESIIVTAPILQVINVVQGLFGLAIEYPLPKAKYWYIRRNLQFSIALYAWYCVTALLVYQSMDASIYFLIASGMFARAWRMGESRGRPQTAGGAVANVV